MLGGSEHPMRRELWPNSPAGMVMETIGAHDGARSIATEPGQSRGTSRLMTPLAANLPMSSTGDKIKGAANGAVGKAKQGVGEAVNSDKMKAKGTVQEAKGDVQ